MTRAERIRNITRRLRALPEGDQRRPILERLRDELLRQEEEQRREGRVD